MNWAPFPAPDGRHFAYVRIGEGNNWDVYLGDLAGGEPRRLTWNPSFDGFPAHFTGRQEDCSSPAARASGSCRTCTRT